MTNFNLKLVFLILGATCIQSALSQKSQWKVLQLPDNWTILTPQNILRKDLQGVDSYVGEIFSSADSLSLSFDIGKSFSIRLTDKFDCSLKTQAKETTKYLHDTTFKKIYNIPHINKAYLDTVSGRIAIIIIPKVIGNGITYVSITDCKTGDWLGISGNNLNQDQNNLVLRMFETINH
jgi:hypothetical protein